MLSTFDNNTYPVVKKYADAWVASDLKAIIESYHDQVVFHYFGRSALAGTHIGKAACLALLKQAKEKTKRKLVKALDVLAGEHFGVIIAIEHFERGDSCFKSLFTASIGVLLCEKSPQASSEANCSLDSIGKQPPHTQNYR